MFSGSPLSPMNQFLWNWKSYWSPRCNEVWIISTPFVASLVAYSRLKVALFRLFRKRPFQHTLLCVDCDCFERFTLSRENNKYDVTPSPASVSWYIDCDIRTRWRQSNRADTWWWLFVGDRASSSNTLWQTCDRSLCSIFYDSLIESHTAGDRFVTIMQN